MRSVQRQLMKQDPRAGGPGRERQSGHSGDARRSRYLYRTVRVAFEKVGRWREPALSFSSEPPSHGPLRKPPSGRVVQSIHSRHKVKRKQGGPAVLSGLDPEPSRIQIYV